MELHTMVAEAIVQEEQEEVELVVPQEMVVQALMLLAAVVVRPVLTPTAREARVGRE